MDQPTKQATAEGVVSTRSVFGLNQVVIMVMVQYQTHLIMTVWRHSDSIWLDGRMA